MKKIYCDGCHEEQVTASNFMVYEPTNHGLRPIEVDLCKACRAYVGPASFEALKLLRSDPDKYKVKYEF